MDLLSRRGPSENFARTPTGFGQVLHALRAERPYQIERLPGEPAWDRGLVAPATAGRRVTLHELGYHDDEIHRVGNVVDDTAIVGPTKILTDDGVRILAATCQRLERYAMRSDFIVTRRLRSADLYSTFIYNMVRDREFLLRCSRMVGVPLIPHPLRTPTVQINYFDGSATDKNEVAKWHRDGMDYVFTMQLDDSDSFEGGIFRYFDGRADEFNAAHRENRLADGGFQRAGDTLFIHGSQIYHAVSPVTKGRRTTFVLSLFCPYLARQDSNTFWHLAGDDGILATIPNWMRLKWPSRDPVSEFSLRSGSPIVCWDDLS